MGIIIISIVIILFIYNLKFGLKKRDINKKDLKPATEQDLSSYRMTCASDLCNANAMIKNLDFFNGIYGFVSEVKKTNFIYQLALKTVTDNFVDLIKKNHNDSIDGLNVENVEKGKFRTCIQTYILIEAYNICPESIPEIAKEATRILKKKLNGKDNLIYIYNNYDTIFDQTKNNNNNR